jgi:hypothetical protein
MPVGWPPLAEQLPPENAIFVALRAPTMGFPVMLPHPPVGTLAMAVEQTFGGRSLKKLIVALQVLPVGTPQAQEVQPRVSVTLS